MSATQTYPKVSEEGFLGSTYTKTGKVITTAVVAALWSTSSDLGLYSLLGKSIILVIGESPTTHR